MTGSTSPFTTYTETGPRSDSPETKQCLLSFQNKFFFYFEIIIDSQEAAQTVQRGPSVQILTCNTYIQHVT